MTAQASNDGRSDYQKSPLHQHVLSTLKADVAAAKKRSAAAKKAAKTRASKNG